MLYFWMSAVRIIAAVWLLTLSTLAQNPRPSTDTLESFISPDGSFRITYPQMMVRCELRRNGDAYDWAQQACWPYIPVCGDEPVPGHPIICIAYPRNEYTESLALEAAAFSVDESDESEKECMKGERAIKGLTLGEVKFKGFESDGIASSQYRTTRTYVAFHRSKCYRLAIAVSTVNAQTFDPPAKEPTKADWADINRRLDQVRDSFRFLK